MNESHSTLATQSGPRRQHVIWESIGPGAAPDILERIRTLNELETLADPATFRAPDMPAVPNVPASSLEMAYTTQSDEVRNLIRGCERWRRVRRSNQDQDRDQGPSGDPTWGFALMVTAYDTASQSLLARALQNCVAAQERLLFHHSCTLPVYAAEALQRLRLDAVQDPGTLDAASDDRVRAEFRALVRDRYNLSDTDTRFLPPARNMACLVLDADAIAVLANLTLPEDPRTYHNWDLCESVKLRVLDAYWEPRSQGESQPEGSYRGVGHLSLAGWAIFYARLTLDANGSAMQDMHPLDGSP